MADLDGSGIMNDDTSDAYDAPATTTTKKRVRISKPDESEKRARLQANDKDIVNPDPETETDEQREEVKRNIGQANLSYDHGVYVIRPRSNASSRQTWPWYCLNFQSMQDYQDWLEPRGSFFTAICRHQTLGAAGNWGGNHADNGNNRLTAPSMLAKLKELVSTRPIQTINMSNVTDAESFEAALGQVPFEAGGKFSSQRIAWVFGCVAWWLISQYGTVYDPRYDDDTDREPLTSFKDAGNDERFVGDKDLPAGITRPSRIQGMVAEDINRAWQLLVQLRKFIRPNKKLITKVQLGTHMCFRPVYLYERKYIPPSAKFAGSAAEAAVVKEENRDKVIPTRQRAFPENTADTPKAGGKSVLDASRRGGEETGDSTQGIEYVTFTLEGKEGDQFFELAKSAILEDDDYDLGLYDFLHSLLKWPKGYVNITGVSVDDREGNENMPVNTLDELRGLVDHEHSVFQLHVAVSSQAAEPEPASQRDYSTHSVLKLRDLAAKLSCDGMDEAEHLFALVRRNHKCSGVFIQDLMDLFAPVRDRVDRQWEEVEELMTLCEKGVNMDSQTALSFRDWVGRLNDQTKQTHAKLYLDLIETQSPLMAHGISELIKLFRPEDGSWEELRGIKDVLDRVSLDAEFDMH